MRSRPRPVRSSSEPIVVMRRFSVCLAICVWIAGSAARVDEPTQAVEYLGGVKPLLAKYCTSCTGAEQQKSGLRLDTAAAVLRGGDTGPAVVAGKSDESLLAQALAGAEGVSAMPPKDQP